MIDSANDRALALAGQHFENDVEARAGLLLANWRVELEHKTMAECHRLLTAAGVPEFRETGAPIDLVGRVAYAARVVELARKGREDNHE